MSADPIALNTRVRIMDGSEAHGDYGTVWQITENGFLLIVLDGNGVDGKGGAIWPCEPSDLEILKDESAGARCDACGWSGDAFRLLRKEDGVTQCPECKSLATREPR